MPHSIEISPSAQRALRKLAKNIARRVDASILSLRKEPRPAGCTNLVGEANTYRIRIGEYRVVYEIQDTVLVILILRIAHRRDVYRRG